MNGSEDDHYRYTMPSILVKFEGASKMRKTVLVNLDDVCCAVGRPADYLLTYLKQQLSCDTHVDKAGRPYLSGAHTDETVQAQILKFIQVVVMCQHCGGPETDFKVEGKKKRMSAYLRCRGCRKRTHLDTTEKMVKHMILHHASDAEEDQAFAAADGLAKAAEAIPVKSRRDADGDAVSHAEAASSIAVAEAATISHDIAEKEKEQEKKKCPSCGHKTRKAMCRCGESMGSEE